MPSLGRSTDLWPYALASLTHSRTGVEIANPPRRMMRFKSAVPGNLNGSVPLDHFKPDKRSGARVGRLPIRSAAQRRGFAYAAALAWSPCLRWPVCSAPRSLYGAATAAPGLRVPLVPRVKSRRSPRLDPLPCRYAGRAASNGLS